MRHLVNADFVRGEVRCHRHSHRRAIAQRDDGLDDALSERLLPDDDRPSGILERPSEHLGGARSATVDENLFSGIGNVDVDVSPAS